jgi:hypothetical protein
MRSFESSAGCRRAATRTSARNALAVVVASLVVFASGATFAAPVTQTITGAELGVEIGSGLPPIVVGQTGTVTPTVSRNSSLVLTGVGIPVPPPVVQSTGQNVPVTDPGAAPIRGVQATVENDAGTFVGTGGAGFGGQMPLIGVNKVCLFGTCSAAISNINVPIGVVGQGGVTFVTDAVNLTVIGAPWTTMTVAIGTITKMGSYGQTTMENTIAGTKMTVDSVSLVTPVFVSTNIGASAVVPVFGIFNFVITTTTPEPGAIAALAASISALVTVGISRRRKR